MTEYNGLVYLSGPILGQTYEEARFGWRQYVASMLMHGIGVLSPMRHEGHLAEMKGTIEANTYPEHFFSGGRIIVEKDMLDIKTADIVLVNLLGAKKVSIGTVSEIGMAKALGKTIVLVMEDPGEAGEDPYTRMPASNIHEHPFVTEPAALRLNNLQDAVYAINSLLSSGV